ncbi:transglycosylase domain-containing protein [Miniphocaeibacter massiliensis]|uniref:transglycosylase domain-containing protein n=1 Tax=Miniphocaeibacter massiliensis TaxID=2041841 RepID=UPI0013EC4187|nr:transglycosylase domain-containing protein [Miniphocaeibacter massiliensis]
MKNKNSKYISKIVKLIVITFLVVFTFMAGALGVSIVGVLESTDPINTNEIDNLVNKTSKILDSNGDLLENVHTTEYRELVPYDKLPKNLINAFIAIEDVRFYEHDGVDPIGIVGAFADNVVSSDMERGASTLAQQLARNLYLSADKKIERKIKEAYLALQLTEQLGRKGVIEKYLNTVFLGQNAYGVQAASKVYFNKDVSELTLAECASLASIVKSPSNYALYKTVLPENITKDDIVVGDEEIELNGTMYKTVYNKSENLENRQKRTLKNMLEEKFITQEEYDKAASENIANALSPGQNSTKQNISSYYIDLTADQVIGKLQSELGLTKDEAIAKYYNGGIEVYSTIDTKMQKQVEGVFENFSDIVLKGTGSSTRPALLDWSSDRNGNITNSKRAIVYYKKENLIDSNGQVYIGNDEYSLSDDGSLILNSSKLDFSTNSIDPKDFYTINDDKNLVTYRTSSSGKAIPNENEIKSTDNGIVISKSFLERYPDFYSVSDSGTLSLGAKYFSIEDGIAQPQGSIVIIDHKQGHIKAIVGGRNQGGRKILNRASDYPRQPGSTMKPIATYIPALDNGYTAASGIEDAPFFYNGKQWPKNVYRGFKGLISLRESVKISSNVNAVKTLDDVGIDVSKEYLTKFGLIDKENPDADSFITASENSSVNDENLSAMGLGGMTYGISNLKMTAAYAAIANGGEYIEPLTFSKVVDYDGTVLLEDVSKKETVVSPQIAYVMTDVMKDVLTVPYGKYAANSNFDIAGKTGTTQENQDIWFIGYSPYYTIGTWIGFDNQQLKLTRNSGQAVKFWNVVNRTILEGYDSARFEEPDGMIHMKVCTIGNGKPTGACYGDGTVKNEIFAKGTEPTGSCKVHGGGSVINRNNSENEGEDEVEPTKESTSPATSKPQETTTPPPTINTKPTDTKPTESKPTDPPNPPIPPKFE